MLTRLFSALLVILISTDSSRADSNSHIGNFSVKVEKDRFGSSDTVIAMVSSGDSVIAVRCLQGTLSLAYIEASFGQGRWEEGLAAAVKLRVDSQPIVDAAASGIGDKGFEINDVDSVIRSMNGAKEVAIRVAARDVVKDTVFQLKQSGKVIPIVLKACAASSTATPSATSTPDPPQPPQTAPQQPEVVPQISSNTENQITATVHNGLSEDDRIRFSAILPAYLVASRCNATLNTYVIVSAIKAEKTETQLFNELSVAETISLFITKQKEAMNPSQPTPDSEANAYCTKAQEDYGPEGKMIKGAVSF